MSVNRQFGAGMYMSNYNMAGIMNTFQVGAAGAYNVSDPKALRWSTRSGQV
jgi:hypothetical protein